ncbi:hypothetical protein [Flavobacterium sp.]|uniref:hypothetical protein n=1 Tax=Flavobacterium sp. TaxID=239 RepID=UPI0031DBDAB6
MHYIIKSNLNRLKKCVINSFEKNNNVLSINFHLIELSNFLEEGYQNKITARKSVLVLKDIISESFHFNRSKEETDLININNDYYITDIKQIVEIENYIELDIVTWKNNQPYDEYDDTDYIIWKVKAKSFQLQWNSFTYW